MAMNGYAAMVRTRSAVKSSGGKRRKMDDYETPDAETRVLTRIVKFKGPILEPAAGSGRMARVLAYETGHKVTKADLKNGQDFTTRKALWPGDVITNPPYKDNLIEAFARKAMGIADGKVALLVEGKWLWGQKRGEGLFIDFVPETIIIITGRIYFYEGTSNKRIKSQFYSHCWVVWPERSKRKKVKPGDTRTYWVSQDEGEFG